MTTSLVPWEISGSTRICGIVADPVDHVQTPRIFNALMRRWGKDVLLVPMHVTPDRLAQAIHGLRSVGNLSGFVVTVPHKMTALEYCDEVSARAHAVGAVNVVRREPDGRLVGDILDGIGFVDGLRESGFDPRGLSVFMAGAGGAANAIAFALAEAGIASLQIWNRTRSKSEDLRDRLLRIYPGLSIRMATNDPLGAELVINATSLGLRDGDLLPLDVRSLEADQIVAEVIMSPKVTPLLSAAQARGCRICFGAPMLDCQLVPMAEFIGISQ